MIVVRRSRLPLLALVLVAALGACREAARRVFAPPEAEFRGVRVGQIGLDGGRLEVSLLLRNPNPYALTARRATYRVFAGDSVEVGRGSTTTRVEVAARDSALVRLPLDVSWRALERVGRSAARAGEVEYRVRGEVEAETPIGPHAFPLDARGTAQLPRLLR